MAASEAEVCNLALSLVGHTQFIDDLNDPTDAGEICALVYGKCRDSTLESFAWPFATRRADLAEIANGARGAWDFAYALPADCLAPRRIWAGTEEASESQKIPFDIEDDATLNKKVLLTNEEDANLVYTRLVTESGKFSPLFVEALAAKIAVYLAAGLVKKPALALQMSGLFRSLIAQAAAAQFNQRQKGTEPDPSIVTERG